MNRRLTGLLAAIAMAILILDSRTALVSAREGLDLCIRTVIPSLFPFFVLSILITSMLSGVQIPWMRPARKMLRIPKGAEALLLTGLIGGYPVGAQCVSQAFEDDSLSKRDAERMLVFCNQCGPAFLFGMIGSILGTGRCWVLWAIQIIGMLITAILLPGGGDSGGVRHNGNGISLTSAMGRAVRTMGQVCGWILLFRVLVGFLERWGLWRFPVEMQALITGLLEISNGTVALRSLTDDSLRFLLCAGMMSFGGVCVIMQTGSAISPKLGRRLYFPGKLLQSGICLTLAAIITGKWILTPVFLLVGAVSLLKIRKNSSISEPIGV